MSSAIHNGGQLEADIDQWIPRVVHCHLILSSTSMSLLAQFSTCEISDALIKLSIPHGGHIPDVNMMSPNPDIRICGPAYTVQMVTASRASGPKLSSHFVDTAPNDSIIVIDVPPGSVLALQPSILYRHSIQKLKMQYGEAS